MSGKLVRAQVRTDSVCIRDRHRQGSQKCIKERWIKVVVFGVVNSKNLLIDSK